MIAVLLLASFTLYRPVWFRVLCVVLLLLHFAVSAALVVSGHLDSVRLLPHAVLAMAIIVISETQRSD